MTKANYRLIKIKSSDDGEVHYKTERGEFDPAETWCGCVDTQDTYEETDEAVTCYGCQNTADVLKDGFIVT